MPQSSLRTLGTCVLRIGETDVDSPSTQKARAILAYLAMHRDADVSRERLLELFWPDTDPERGRDSLRTALWSIRRCVRSAGVDADGFLFANKSVVRWAAQTSVDAEEFERTAAGSDADLPRALSLYKGDFLEGDYEDWAVGERERLAALFEAALSRSLKLSPDAQTAQRLLARNPYDEEAYATLIESELASGRRMAAMAYVDRCRAALREMGEEPSESFERRFGSIGHAAAAPSTHMQLPFVGRESTLAEIVSALDACERGSGSMTIVHGEAGIGKSTVLSEAARLACARSIRVLTVSCADGGSRMFGPWPQLFEAVAGADFAALAQGGGPGAADGYADAITSALTGSTLLIVDDAHALRGEALDILKALVTALAARHAILVATRPEGLGELRRCFAGAPFEEMKLQPLHRGELESAFAQLTGEPSSPVFEALFERTGGHPLFFSAMLAVLASSGAATREGYRWRFTPDATASLKLPSSLRRHIDARLRSCGDDACAVACAIALEPRASTDQLIDALAFSDERTLDALDDLLAHGLIVEPETGPQFAFSHDIVAEVAATLLNAGRRARLHRAFAEQLQKEQAPDRWLRLARHLREAGKPLEAGAAYHEAALEAMEWSAYADVIARAAEGIATVESLDRTPARDGLLALLERAQSGGYAFNGDAIQGIAPAGKAVAHARASGDREILLRTLLARAFAFGESGDFANQFDDATEAIGVARELGDEIKLAKALVQRSTAATLLGRAQEVQDDLCEAHDIAAKHGEWGLASTALAEMTYAGIVSRHFAQALDAANRGLAAARQAEPSSLATAYHNRAALWYAVDRFDDALSDLAAAESVVSQGMQERWGRGGIMGPTIVFAISYLRGQIEARRQRWEAAIACLDSIRRDAPRIVESPRYGCAFRLLAIDVFLRRDAPGDVEKASAEAQTLPADLERRGLVGWSDSPAVARARIGARQGRRDSGELLAAALAGLERTADVAPLDVDRWFAALAASAAEADSADVAAAASQRAAHHLDARRTSAAALWGGDPAVPSTTSLTIG